MRLDTKIRKQGMVQTLRDLKSAIWASALENRREGRNSLADLQNDLAQKIQELIKDYQNELDNLSSKESFGEWMKARELAGADVVSGSLPRKHPDYQWWGDISNKKRKKPK